MKNVLFPALALMHSDMVMRAKADEAGAGEVGEATEKPEGEASKPGSKRFTPEQIKEIRDLRAEKREDGRPLHSHAALAKRFGTNAGAISHIVRNRTYKSENYVPVNDGK